MKDTKDLGQLEDLDLQGDMTKEELIEYFLEQLGDNKILGQVMTKEQIRNKLDTVIEGVEYCADAIDSEGGWHIQECWVNFDPLIMFFLSKEEKKNVIIHELLHALSTDTKKRPHTSGFIIEGINAGINEGFTEYLTIQISGNKSEVYSLEQKVIKTLFLIIEKEVLLKKYFHIPPYESSREPIDDEVGKKYGNEVYQKLKKVLKLLDSVREKKIRKESFEKEEIEINSILIQVLEEIIQQEAVPDIKKAIMIREYFGMEYQELRELEESKNLEEVMGRIIFDSENPLNLTLEDILAYWNAMSVKNNNPSNIIYDLYAQKGKIKDTQLFKKTFFSSLFAFAGSKCWGKEKLETFLEKLKYHKIGDFFLVNERKMYDSTGQLLEGVTIQDSHYEEELDDYASMGEWLKLDRDGVKKLYQEIEEIQKNTQDYWSACVYGEKLVRIKSKNDNYFFVIENDGSLTSVKRRKKKVYK